MPKVYATIYGGNFHGKTVRYRPRRNALQRFHVHQAGDEIVLVDRAWPKDRIPQCLALSRIYGYEWDWPIDIKRELFGPEETWPWFV